MSSSPKVRETFKLQISSSLETDGIIMEFIMENEIKLGSLNVLMNTIISEFGLRGGGAVYTSKF